MALIGFIGSVFSPYYARARRRSPIAADPSHFCALNVALYRGSRKRWALTERGRQALRRSARELAIGPSSMSWDGTALCVDIEEWTVPLPSRIRGRIRLLPECGFGDALPLDAGGLHHWWPIAPCARVEVELLQPALRWSGRAYWDSNFGDVPLEETFRRWTWSRSELDGGQTAVLYDLHRWEGEPRSLALRFQPDGGVRTFVPPPAAPLPPGLVWRVARATRADGPARVQQTLEDTPFYTRSLLSGHLLGESVVSMHESLSLERFRQPWVQMLLPFRMPRRSRVPPRGSSLG